MQLLTRQLQFLGFFSLHFMRFMQKTHFYTVFLTSVTFFSPALMELGVRVYLDLQNRCWRTTDVCTVEYIHTFRQMRRPECDVNCDLKTC